MITASRFLTQARRLRTYKGVLKSAIANAEENDADVIGNSTSVRGSRRTRGRPSSAGSRRTAGGRIQSTEADESPASSSVDERA